MKLFVNGESHEHTGNVTDLLTALGANPEHAAVTVNGDIVFPKDWKNFKFNVGDTVEVLTFVGGG